MPGVVVECGGDGLDQGSAWRSLGWTDRGGHAVDRELGEGHKPSLGGSRGEGAVKVALEVLVLAGNVGPGGLVRVWWRRDGECGCWW